MACLAAACPVNVPRCGRDIAIATACLHQRLDNDIEEMLKQSSASKGKQREPPPSLFLGPPSQNTSHVSLPGILNPGNNLVPTPHNVASPIGTVQRAPLSRQGSQRFNPRAHLDGSAEAAGGRGLGRTIINLPRNQHASEGQNQADRTEALWAEMQSTLEEVEISAVNGVHVFGPKHNEALEELRTAQIALAQAWARSEADNTVEAADKESRVIRSSGIMASETNKSGVGATDGAKSAAESTSGRPGSSAGDKPATKHEEETEADILLARKRREANDRYFDRVNSGVLDVVAKLEEVARAMKAVEEESRDIWGDSESGLTSNT